MSKEQKFNCMNFDDGGYPPMMFVASKRAYPTKELAVNVCLTENECFFKDGYHGKALREPTVDDVSDNFCKHYVHAPYRCSQQYDGGMYTFAPEDERGAFPVWVIDYFSLKRGPCANNTKGGSEDDES